MNSGGVYHAFLYLDGYGMAKLSDLVVNLPAGFRLTRDSQDRIRINDAGQIAGTGLNAAGIAHAYLLTP